MEIKESHHKYNNKHQKSWICNMEPANEMQASKSNSNLILSSKSKQIKLHPQILSPTLSHFWRGKQNPDVCLLCRSLLWLPWSQHHQNPPSFAPDWPFVHKVPTVLHLYLPCLQNFSWRNIDIHLWHISTAPSDWCLQFFKVFQICWKLLQYSTKGQDIHANYCPERIRVGNSLQIS